MQAVLYSPDDYGSLDRRFFADIIDGILLGLISPLIDPSWAFVLLILAYLVGFKTWRGNTAGYYLLGLKIVSINGEDVTIAQILIRVFASIFSFLLLGMGFFSIIWDRNKQAWHDKVAGTYVIRAEATPLGTEEIPQTSLIRGKLLGRMALVSVAEIGALIGLAVNSDAYRLSEQYVRENSWIRQEVGSIRFIFPSGLNFSFSTSEDGEASFRLHVWGDSGKAVVAISVKETMGKWAVTEADLLDSEENYIDIRNLYSNLLCLNSVQEGRYAEAEERCLAALREAETLGPDDPRFGASLNNLASLYHAQGKYAEAEPLFERALAIDEKALGKEHPDVATDLNNLAGLYHAQARYAEAESLYNRSLAIAEKALGPEHPDVGQSLNNLAALYAAQAKYAEAEPLYRRSLAIREKALGPEHPDVGQSLNNLAGLYHSQGKYAEAEPLAKRALAIYEKALGPEHPDVALSLNNLAFLYYTQGKYAEGEPLFQRALAIREKTLGPEHPLVAQTLGNYADLLRKVKRNDEAAKMEARAKAIRDKQQ